jgi:8-oxo-dGTP pyrophosphatase MutT (NUDIX family)|tara:strand:- start:725 stop:1183 length:459 start_codon:yes stop_codon:yes gene_type:complete
MLNNEMIEERSAGAVIFNEDDGVPNFLLLNYPAGHWDFPKGHIEKGELLFDTIKREVSEETGMKNIKILPSFKKKIVYYYRRNIGMVRKEVIYVLARALTWNVSLSHEHKNYVWLDLEKALNKVTYRNSKNILKLASKFLDDAPIHRDELVP